MTPSHAKEKLVVESYAIFERGYWYAALKYILDGKQHGEDEVLRALPCQNVDAAMKLGHEFAATVDRARPPPPVQSQVRSKPGPEA